MAKFIEKLKALAQWWYQLERQEHRHWCKIRKQPRLNGYELKRNCCDGSTGCWSCIGIKCESEQYKDCPKCIADRDKILNG